MFVDKGDTPCTVRNIGSFGPVFYYDPVTAETTIFSDRGLPHIVTESKNPHTGFKQNMFCTKKAKTSSIFKICCAFWTYIFQVLSGFEVGHRKLTLLLGA